MICYLFLYRNPQVNKAYEAYNEVEVKAMGNDSIAVAEYKKVLTNIAAQKPPTLPPSAQARLFTIRASIRTP